jgi:predicted Zn-dependent protease
MQAMSRIPINNETNFVSLMPKNFTGAQNLSNVLKPLNLLKGTAAANAALAGATVITVAFAVIQSVAIDQFIAIQTARPKLEAALAQAQQPVNLNQLLSQPNGSDLSIYYWAKAMEADFVIEDPQLVALAAAAHQQAQSTGYRLALAQ